MYVFGRGPQAFSSQAASAPALLWFLATALIMLCLSTAPCRAAALLASLTGLVGNNLVISNYSSISTGALLTQRQPLSCSISEHPLDLNHRINQKYIKQIRLHIWSQKLLFDLRFKSRTLSKTWTLNVTRGKKKCH